MTKSPDRSFREKNTMSAVTEGAFPAGAQGHSDRDLQSAMRKNTLRLLPILMLAYFFNYIDRTSVGFAALQMNKDIALSATQFGWGAGIMFFGATACWKYPATWRCITSAPGAGSRGS
jgi:hypothetical protein